LRTDAQHRAVACLRGLAVGDAVGKQTETLRFPEVRTWYPGGVRGFEGKPGAVIPRYRGKRYEWRIGETTDDTEQTLAVAAAVVRDKAVSHRGVGRELLRCTKSLHPGVSLWEFVQAADPGRVAGSGDGCGAAMRVAPVGLLNSSRRLEKTVSDAFECSVPTHGGQSAICAACAVASAISVAIDGGTAADALSAAVSAATLAETLRPPTRPCTVAASLTAMHAALRRIQPLTPDAIAAHWFPDTPETIVPLAISLAVLTESAETTALLAANVGGDADSVASIGSAIAAALRPETVNESWFGVVEAVNGHDVAAAALSVAALRN
jgi:ADP-ribosylglycohydrolase